MLSRLREYHSSTRFEEKHSDLFHFYQSKELADQPALSPFKAKLLQQYRKLRPSSKKDVYFHIFASYYLKGDYLLVHDDLVADRDIAFSFYL
jgi:hypothetical protein